MRAQIAQRKTSTFQILGIHHHWWTLIEPEERSQTYLAVEGE